MYTISLLCNIQILRERPHVSPQPQPQPPSLQASKLLRSLTAMRRGDSRRRPTKIWFDLICVHMIWYDFMWFHMIWWSYINDMKLFEPKKTSWNGWHSCSLVMQKKLVYLESENLHNNQYTSIIMIQHWITRAQCRFSLVVDGPQHRVLWKCASATPRQKLSGQNKRKTLPRCQVQKKKKKKHAGTLNSLRCTLKMWSVCLSSSYLKIRHPFRNRRRSAQHDELKPHVSWKTNPLVMTHSSPLYRWPIEIDGLPKFTY